MEKHESNKGAIVGDKCLILMPYSPGNCLDIDSCSPSTKRISNSDFQSINAVIIIMIT